MSDPSVQLYTLREALDQDFDGTLGRLAELGYRQVEPFALGRFGDELRAGLAAHGLTAPTTHAGLLDDGAAGVLALAQELGIGTVFVPFTDPARWQDADAIAQIAAELNAAAERAADHGIRVGYHNHHFELESMFGGRHGLEVLVDGLSSDVVLEVDTYWAYAGGADVPALLTRLGERVVALHVKDGDGTLDKTKQVAVGAGVLPIWDIVDAAPGALRVAELDDTEGDVFEALRASRAFLLAGRPVGPGAGGAAGAAGTMNG